MDMQLRKTLLTTKPSPQSVMTALIFYLVIVLVFIVDNQALSANGELVYSQGKYWKAFTSQLMHGDFGHLGNNTLFFMAFAVLLNHYFGFWIFPVLSFLVGGLINLIVLKIYEPNIYLVGISGVIYFMAAFWMTLFVGIERHMTLYRRVMITTGVSLILFFPEVFQKNVSYLAHGLGFGFGIFFGLIYFWLRKNKLREHEVWVETASANHELEEYIDSLRRDEEIREHELSH